MDSSSSAFHAEAFQSVSLVEQILDGLIAGDVPAMDLRGLLDQVGDVTANDPAVHDEPLEGGDYDDEEDEPQPEAAEAEETAVPGRVDDDEEEKPQPEAAEAEETEETAVPGRVEVAAPEKPPMSRAAERRMRKQASMASNPEIRRREEYYQEYKRIMKKWRDNFVKSGYAVPEELQPGQAGDVRLQLFINYRRANYPPMTAAIRAAALWKKDSGNPYLPGEAASSSSSAAAAAVVEPTVADATGDVEGELVEDVPELVARPKKMPKTYKAKAKPTPPVRRT